MDSYINRQKQNQSLDILKSIIVHNILELIQTDNKKAIKSHFLGKLCVNRH